MANKVSFIIQLKNQFGKTAEKANRQFSKIKQSADKASNSVSTFASKTKVSLRSVGKSASLAGAAMTAALTVPLVAVAKNSISAASAAEEVGSKFRDVFVGVGGQAEDAAARLSKAYAFANSSSKDLLSTTGAILSASGLQKDRIVELSETLVGASRDLSSFHDFQGSAAESSLILSKALLGEAESLKTNFGITILQNKAFQDNVKLKMKTQGLTQSAAKAEVIFAEIMRQAGKKGQNALGNFNKTKEEYANQVRITAERKKEFAESIGKILIPIATKWEKLQQRLFKRFSELSPETRKIVVAIGAFLAIGGPLLVLLGGIALIVSVVTIKMLLIGAAIGALIAIGTALWLNWDTIVTKGKQLWQSFADKVVSIGDAIGSAFTSVWESVKSGLVAFVNIGIGLINTLLAPLNFVAEKLGFGSVKIQPIQAPASIQPIQAPSAPSQGANGQFNGELTVKAESGTRVRRGRSRNRGSSNIGMNMVTQ